MGVLAFIALGSNIGDSIGNVRSAINRLQDFAAEPLRSSSLWETTPVDCPPDAPPFVNAVVAMAPLPRETPESLLLTLQSLEREFGRKPKKILNESRPLDLDLIAFDQEKRSSNELTLPHPRAHQRRFVLQPLAELAPDLVLPGQSKTVQELLCLLPPDPSMKRLGQANP
jgi:2-amino-4-hydroxy-6-hydroxymethyldihydropteridine diphosphokinase